MRRMLTAKQQTHAEDHDAALAACDSTDTGLIPTTSLAIAISYSMWRGLTRPS